MCSCIMVYSISAKSQDLGAYCTVQEHNRMSLKQEFILCGKLWQIVFGKTKKSCTQLQNDNNNNKHFCHCVLSLAKISSTHTIQQEANIEPQHTNNIHLWNSSLNFKQLNLGKHHLNSLNIYLKKEKLLSESFTLLHCESVAYGLTRPELSRSSMLGSGSSLELW